MRKMLKRGTALALAAALTVGLTLPAGAVSATPSEKEEVVYINLDAVGAVQEIYVVNSFGSGDILDYGDYVSIKALNTLDDITQNGDEITFTTTAEKVYYQGELTDKEIPWNFDIRYYLDGTEYDPSELAGQSGALEIRLSITENEACEGGFFDAYALQVSLTLDTENCTNISAPDATVANVGSEKQLTFTVLPGSGLDTSVTADVTDFEMEGIAINGIRLNLNIEIDDEELMEQVTELMDAAVQLDDGAGELADGASALAEGTSELADGASELQDGAAELADGASALDTGTDELADGADELTDGASSLADGAGEAKEGAADLQDGASSLASGASALADGASSLADGASSLADGAAAVESGASSLVDGTAALQSGAEELNSGLADLQTGLAQV
ncbi:MAG: hypothetical protein LUC87_09820 [Clostridiales bacterium]|nr:hypothetical protein [Clostridiales bacterium]